MNIDRTTLQLFPSYPREVGNPKRSVVQDLRGFLRFIDRNNGKSDCFVGLYGLSKIVDKVFFDFDNLNSLEECKKIYTYCREIGLTVIPVFSGRRGFHLHIPILPYIPVDQKVMLRNAALSILYGALNGEASSVDNHVIGDVSRLCRVPNTLRPEVGSNNWCTYLSSDFTSMTIGEVLEYSKSPHSFDGEVFARRKTLKDFPIVDCDFQKFKLEEPSSSLKISEPHLLRQLLRPCLFESIRMKEPRHEVRVAVTVDLLDCGYSVDEVCETYSKIGWADFNPDVTRYQVEYIAGRMKAGRLSRYGARGLKVKGLCGVRCGCR